MAAPFVPSAPTVSSNEYTDGDEGVAPSLTQGLKHGVQKLKEGVTGHKDMDQAAEGHGHGHGHAHDHHHHHHHKHQHGSEGQQDLGGITDAAGHTVVDGSTNTCAGGYSTGLAGSNDTIPHTSGQAAQDNQYSSNAAGGHALTGGSRLA